jgi:hypothetical protein
MARLGWERRAESPDRKRIATDRLPRRISKIWISKTREISVPVKKKCGDYHNEMNGPLFKERRINLLRGLGFGCIIVTDNASYHSQLGEKIPSRKTKTTDKIS